MNLTEKQKNIKLDQQSGGLLKERLHVITAQPKANKTTEVIESATSYLHGLEKQLIDMKHSQEHSKHELRRYRSSRLSSSATKRQATLSPREPKKPSEMFLSLAVISTQQIMLFITELMAEKTPKQAATEGSCSKGLAEHLKGGNTRWCPWVLHFRQTANGFHPSSEKILIIPLSL